MSRFMHRFTHRFMVGMLIRARRFIMHRHQLMRRLRKLFMLIQRRRQRRLISNAANIAGRLWLRVERNKVMALLAGSLMVLGTWCKASNLLIVFDSVRTGARSKKPPCAAG